MAAEKNGENDSITVMEHHERISPVAVEHLRTAIKQAMKSPETQELVELMCENNGMTLEEFLQAPHEFTSMELFLISTPNLPQLRLFPYLKVVKIIHVGLQSMEPLSHLHYVEELWLNDNNIRVIEGLEQLHELKLLFLQGNYIKSMDGMPLLPKLEKLWLCRNELLRISELASLPKLKSLWVSSNRIAALDNTFSPSMTSLEELNLSNNQIYFFSQLKHLSALKSLRVLWLSDPMYGDAPIFHLSNYTTFSLQHLPYLELLDGVAITPEQRSLATSVYTRKSIYYSMRGAILDGNVAMMQSWVHREAEKRRNIAREAIRYLDLELIEFSEYGREHPHTGRRVTVDEENHLNTLKRARETREVELEGIERQLLEASKRTVFERDTLHERLLLELNSCGSIRLEEGTENDNWYANAKELLTSRFDTELYESMGVTGVKANRIYRITCQGLRERFDSRMRELDIDLADTRNRRALVRLFSAVPRQPQEQRSFLYEVMTNGFAGMYAEQDGVPLTNSLFYADQERLISLKGNRDFFSVTSQPELLSAQLLVSRLFLGKCVAEMGSVRNASSEEGGNKGPELPFMSGRRKVTRRHYGDEVFSVYRTCPNNPATKVWHMFDKCLLLPEYVIDFTYTTRSHLTVDPPLSIYERPEVVTVLLEKMMPVGARDAINDLRTAGYPWLAFLNWLNNNSFHVYGNGETEKALARAKELRRVKNATFSVNGPLSSEAVQGFMKAIGQPTSGEVSYCNMSKRQIHSIPSTFSSSLWSSLKKLILHDNKISFISWEALSRVSPMLEFLDIGNNEMERLEFGKANFPSLRSLFLSFNKFHVLEDVLELQNGAPALICLHMDHNPWMNSKASEAYCVSVLPQLEQLNGINVSRHAQLMYLRRRTIKMTHETLQYLVAEEHKRRMSESAASAVNGGGAGTAEEVGSSSGSNSAASNIVRFRFFEQVLAELSEQLVLDRPIPQSQGTDPLGVSTKNARVFCFHSSLTRNISWVAMLPQLRYLTLTSHLIEDITPLAELRHLKTLNLSDNLVKSAKPLEGMKLVSLDLSRNCLSGVDGLSGLSELRFLSVRQNTITDISSLQQCSLLEELYLADNMIANVRDLCPLQSIPKLVSLDAVGNPCAPRTQAEECSECRNYLLYNMPKLKVLDGLPVVEADQQRARDVFAGRVSSDLLVERVGAAETWETVQEIDLSHCGLRELTMPESFGQAKVFHLHHNYLERIDGLLPLQSLVALDLSHNRLGHSPIGKVLQQLPNLLSLSLEANHITDVSLLCLALPQLQFLNLKNNEIGSLDNSLCGLVNLRELLLDNNKMRALGPDCFANNLQLTDVSADENYIRSTEGLQSLTQLSVLSLGSNRLTDLRALLQSLRNSCCLVDITLSGNALARKPPYRPQVIGGIPTLIVLDRRGITDEERDRAELLRTAEHATPHNVVLDPNFPAEAVGGARACGPAGPLRSIAHQPRFPVPATPRLQLPAYKNPRGEVPVREGVGRGYAPRVQGNR
ncbi:putative Leucine rich repeat Leucine rich repeat [Trypanosoma vivax]|uniref:Protein phosphatase 1 regulatory subunit 7 n=1 Tax=Trypanosoma vivax (strain Y486) TaxID=1055687 RepID=G0UB66_TRYVY|nr:putative Leucine rich repeat Leucine rich repeat [Trypanosoma vivax]CCC53053.1 conserved hypothetical protein [Trypanosoma vivax Y486]